VATFQTGRLTIRTSVGVITAITILWVLVYIFWVLNGSYDPQLDMYVSGLGLVFINASAAAFGFYISRQPDIDPRLRRSWLFIALGVLCMAIVEALWFIYAIFNTQLIPFGTQFFYLLYYPLILIGLLYFPFAPVTRKERSIYWLDIAIVLIACSMIYWVFIINPLRSILEQYPEGLIAIAYPVGDILLFAGIAALLQRDVQKVARWTLFFLACGAALTAFADGLFIYCNANGIPCELPYLNILWLVSALCTLIAAGLHIASSPESLPETPIKTNPTNPYIRLILPYLSVAGGWLLLIIIANNNREPDLRLKVVLYGAILLGIFALIRQLIVLLDNVRLYKEMERLAITDSLTGLYNRHFFNETFEREVERARRHNNSLSVLLMDIDDFKIYNDIYGHLRGDEVLRTIASVLKQQLRSTDILARFGGDEFAVILPRTGREGSRAVARKIESAVSEKTYVEHSMGISIGVGIFRPDLSPEQLIDMADKALYRHKSTKIQNVENTPIKTRSYTY
jgi:diguanylate cyclase (GGDEF)-like protein